MGYDAKMVELGILVEKLETDLHEVKDQLTTIRLEAYEQAVKKRAVICNDPGKRGFFFSEEKIIINALYAVGVYSEIRKKISMEKVKITPNIACGNFIKWYRAPETRRAIAIIEDYPMYFENEKFPKMKALLLYSATPTVEMVKAAVLEDFTFFVKNLDKTSRTYENYLRFQRVVREFK